jgi:hypothetical protein
MLLGGLKKDFPYPEKLCPYCNWKMVPVNAIHWQEDVYQYKALYLDNNPNCSAYDEGARLAYARIYYTSEDAFHYFRDVKMPVQRWSQEDLYSIYE